ncbi:MAG: HAMP domain-containing sensor histidine kinase [Myxococcota bacterium]
MGAAIAPSTPDASTQQSAQLGRAQRVTIAVGAVLAGVLGVTGAHGLVLAGLVVVVLVSGLGLLTSGSSGFRVGSRLYLFGVLLGLGVVLSRATPAVFTVSTVMLGYVVVLAGAWERERAGSALWTLGAVAIYVVAVLAAHGQGALGVQSMSDVALLGLGVPVGFVVMGGVSHSLTNSLQRTLELSEVARAKLSRSNAQLVVAMQDSQDALVKLGTIVNTLGEGLVAVTLDGRIELANPALSTLLDHEVPTGAAMEDVLPEALQTLVRSCLHDAAPGVRELPLSGGRTARAAASPIVLEGTGRRVWGVALLVRDVTLANEIDRMKSDFAATVSHEMRTPLTSVLGFTKLVQRQLSTRLFPLIPEDDVKAHKARATVEKNLSIILDEGKRLTALINDVLDISKMESGQMTWALDRHAPLGLVQRAMDATASLFPEDGPVTPRFDVAPSVPEVWADHDRILQVLINLIGNAAKFTEAGEVVVTAEARGAFVEFAVRDTGHGIGPGDREAVFEKFRQVGDVLTDRPTGTGLGLPICREIVTHHGGSIDVESVLGEGSRFTFTLPLGTEPRPGVASDDEDPT